MKLSIIVPVYNVEQYLRKCVDSILAQGVPGLEVILVDDGSTDDSPRICDEYAEKDTRIRVIHKPNGGLSDARNAGLDVAQGEFVGFVDSDDFVSTEMYQELIKLAEENDAQICSCGFIKVDGQGGVITQYPTLTMNTVYSKSDFINHYYPDIRWQLLSNVCNKIFRRELFRTVRFPKGLIYEDAFVLLELLDQCSTVAVSQRHLYYYLHRVGSIANSGFSPSNMCAIDLYLRYYNFFFDRGLQNQAQYALDELTTSYLQAFFAVKICRRELRPLLKLYTARVSRLLFRIVRCTNMCRIKRFTFLSTYVSVRLAFKLCRKFFPECIYSFMR